MKVIGTLIFILLVVVALFGLIGQATVDSCNTKDEFGQFIHRDSWVCATEHGERIRYEGN